MSAVQTMALLEGGDADGRVLAITDLVGDERQRALYRGPGRGWVVYRAAGRRVLGAGAPCEVWEHCGDWVPSEPPKERAPDPVFEASPDAAPITLDVVNAHRDGD